MELTSKESAALTAKKKARDSITLSVEELEPPPRSLTAVSLSDFEPGKFQGLDRIRLCWIGKPFAPGYMMFIPRNTQPFRFIPSKRDPVEPRTFFTDGGTIPPVFQTVVSKLDPWYLAPAYLLHDWQFDLHHCKDTTLEFEDVNETMMEAIATLVRDNNVEVSDWIVNRIYWAINKFGGKYWSKEYDECPIPPDRPE